MARKIRDKNTIYSIISANVDYLHHFAIMHKLTNVEIRCDEIIRKINNHVDVEKLYLDSLKDDLYADILGPDYYCASHYRYIPPSNSPSYKVALSISKLDDHIFGGLIAKKSLKPIKLTFNKEYFEIMNRITKNILPNLRDLSSKDFTKVLDNSSSVMMLTTFRSMHDVVLEANKLYLKMLDQLIYGKFNESMWEEIVAYDRLFALKNGSYESDFKVIGGASSHGCYVINGDMTITIEPDSDKYINNKITYNQNELASMLFTQYYKFVDFFPAMIAIETIINNKTYFEDKA